MIMPMIYPFTAVKQTGTFITLVMSTRIDFMMKLLGHGCRLRLVSSWTC